MLVPSLTHPLAHNSFLCYAEMVLDSVGKCDVDVRRDLYSGIILTGNSIFLAYIAALGMITEMYVNFVC